MLQTPTFIRGQYTEPPRFHENLGPNFLVCNNNKDFFNLQKDMKIKTRLSKPLLLKNLYIARHEINTLISVQTYPVTACFRHLTSWKVQYRHYKCNISISKLKSKFQGALILGKEEIPVHCMNTPSSQIQFPKNYVITWTKPTEMSIGNCQSY